MRLQGIQQSQPQDSTRILWVFGFGATYIRDLTVGIGVRLLHNALSCLALCPVRMAVTAFVYCKSEVCWQIYLNWGALHLPKMSAVLHYISWTFYHNCVIIVDAPKWRKISTFGLDIFPALFLSNQEIRFYYKRHDFMVSCLIFHIHIVAWVSYKNILFQVVWW